MRSAFRCLVALVLLSGCGGPATETEVASPSGVAGALEGAAGAPADDVEATSGVAAAAPGAAGPYRVVYLGDSLAAGFGLPEEEAFPAVVETLLCERGLGVETVNAGVSGDTTAGGRSRIGWLLRQRPDLVVVELGANDGLRGLSPEMTEENLVAIVEAVLDSGAGVLLTGMKVPPNYGGDYARRFEAVFTRLAEAYPVEFLPFLLEGVAGERALNLPDGIHPNAEGHRRVAANLAPRIEAALSRRSPRAP